MDVDRRLFSRPRRVSKPSEGRERNSPRKRSYQREHTHRRESRQSREQTCQNDDLRSPCHKQPRFKGEKENSPSNSNTVTVNHGPWNHNMLVHVNNTGKDVFGNVEFPPLGFNADRFTPEPEKNWGKIVEQEELESNKESRKPSRFKRRLLLSDASDTNVQDTSKTQKPDEKPNPKVLRPVITDPHKLTQRQKQIDIGKNTVSYGQYIKNIARNERSKEDPWTPDKFQQCSTRSWVGQMKVWRRRLHSYDLSSDHQEELFSTPSTSCSQATDEASVDVGNDKKRSGSIEDMFKDFDLDSCFMDDGLPL